MCLAMGAGMQDNDAIRERSSVTKRAGQPVGLVRRHGKGLAWLACGLALGGVVTAHAAELVNGLYVFGPGQPARAAEINHNFATLAQADADLDQSITDLEARLDARIAAIETNTKPLQVTIAQGARFFVPKGGDVLGSATCPAGTRPISGMTHNGDPYCSAVAEEFIEGNSWKVRIKQAFCTQSYHGGIDVDIWAVCIPSE